MARALVLNATYEPLGIVSARRATMLVFTEKAITVEEGEGVVRSEHLRIVEPSVVRLRYFVRVPYQRRASLSRRAVFLRDGNRCQYCGTHADSIDHVIPRSRGGKNEWENVVAACRRCNLAKSDRLLEEITMRLRRPPHAPRHLSGLVVAIGRVPDAWKPYLGEHQLSA